MGDQMQRIAQEVLSRAASVGGKPADDDFAKVHSYLVPESSSSTSHRSHWFCSNTESDTVREAATYLLFLFAFHSKASDDWIRALEDVTDDCDQCARRFSGARRHFGRRYLTTFPTSTRDQFFATVDKWQADHILRHVDHPARSSSLDAQTTLSGLSRSLTQLLLGDPSLLKNAQISSLLDRTIALAPKTSNVVAFGLTPVLVRLLSSPSAERRKWAVSLLTAAGRHPVSLHEFEETGIGTEIVRLYAGDGDISTLERWRTIHKMLKTECLNRHAIIEGLIALPTGKVASTGHEGIVAYLIPLLSQPEEDFSELLEVFADLLRSCPDARFWSFDSSLKTPSRLLNDLRKNAAFRSLLEQHALTELSKSTHRNQEKGKMPQATDHNFEPLCWLVDLVNSVRLATANGEAGDREAHARIFDKLLSEVVTFLMTDIQEHQESQDAKAYAAKTCFKVLQNLQDQLRHDDGPAQTSLSSIIEAQATTFTAIIFRRQPRLSPLWDDAREAGRNLLVRVFQCDGRDLIERLLGLSVIASNEKARRARARKAKASNKPIPPAEHLTFLPLVNVHKSLWQECYDALSSDDVEGAVLLLSGAAFSAPIESLTRKETWGYSEIGLREVIDKTPYDAAVSTFNSSLQAMRGGFPTALESIALQPASSVLSALWKHKSVSEAVIMLLLSPVEDVHDPVITLIQQSFDDVDDRSDCFQVMLSKYPAKAMDGLINYLDLFVKVASRTPESCSMSKWLVRCFTDVLEVLCSQANSEEPLLQRASFLTQYADGTPMKARVLRLWELMCDALTVIFKHTPDWAPLYDTPTMVDWMRDALIFGRQLADHFRAFEAAALGQSSASAKFADHGGSTPLKGTRTGAKLLENMQPVLQALTSWLRLTDVETLHQTFELVKTILGRLAKTQQGSALSSTLEETLLQLDRFSRRDGNSYRSRLSDDLLSELSGLLTPFNLVFVVDDDDEVEFLGSASPAVQAPDGANVEAPSKVQEQTASREAWRALMKRDAVSQSSRPTTGEPSKKSTKTEDDFDDGFLDDISEADLGIIERRATQASSKITPTTIASNGKPLLSKPSVTHKSVLSGNTKPPSHYKPEPSRLNINVVPKAAAVRPSGASSFRSQIMRDAQQAHRQQVAERDRNNRAIGGIVPAVPSASRLGSGLGAYQGARPKKEAVVVNDSSSDSDSSGDDKQSGLKELIAKQKESPKKKAVPLERKPLKIIATTNTGSEFVSERDRKRAEQEVIRKRLKPDMSLLYRNILAWNPDHTGTLAPNPPGQSTANLSAIPSSFASSEQYQKVILPLFLQELWAQCQNESLSRVLLTVQPTSRAYEDEFIDIELNTQGLISKDLRFGETDLVVLRRPSCASILAKVQSFKHRPQNCAISVRILASIDQNQLIYPTTWQLSLFTSLSTASREFAALKGLPYYDSRLLADALAGRSAELPKINSDIVEQIQKDYQLNEPQARAILGALRARGFALIQGPPGTGKTKTISGLVGKFLMERKMPISVSGEKSIKPKLLICAPSNAATDEVARRLADGIPGPDGRRIDPTVIRIGNEAKVSPAIMDITLDSVVARRTGVDTTMNDGNGDFSRVQLQLATVKTRIKEIQMMLQGMSGNDQGRKRLEEESHTLLSRRTQLGHQLSKAKDAAQDAMRDSNASRRAVREEVLRDADVICATLAGSGQDILQSLTFETVIIDEAAQAVELSCLIPLKYGCKTCIMIGDPNQLPPTIISPEVERYHYNESLFVRIVRKSTSNAQLLSIQYRMHPFISELPSKVFYNGKLKDGPGMAKKTVAIWHERNVYGPYRFFDVHGTEAKKGTSTYNVQEALAAVDLYQSLERDFGDQVNMALRIGVVTMYKEQMWEMKQRFSEAFGGDILQRIEFNTVDGFQGQEKDIIILSCVRSGPGVQSIGFLKDPRRMNVALTRAKSSLFIIGNAATLERSDERWKTIVSDARERGFLIKYGPETFARSVSPVPLAQSRQTSSGVKKEFSSSPTQARAPKRKASSEAVVNGASSSQTQRRNPTSKNALSSDARAPSSSGATALQRKTSIKKEPLEDNGKNPSAASSSTREVRPESLRAVKDEPGQLESSANTPRPANERPGKIVAPPIMRPPNGNGAPNKSASRPPKPARTQEVSMFIKKKKPKLG